MRGALCAGVRGVRVGAGQRAHNVAPLLGRMIYAANLFCYMSARKHEIILKMEPPGCALRMLADWSPRRRVHGSSPWVRDFAC